MNNLSVIPASGGTFCLSKAGLAIGGTATKAKIAAPNGAGVDFCIDGKLYHKADTDDCILFTGLTQAANTTCAYFVCLNASGTVSVVQSDEVDATLYAGGDVVIPLPDIGSDVCPIGYILLTVTAAFTGATTELSAATVTDTYVDLFAMPSRPLSM